MEDARQRVIRKILALPEDKQQRINDSTGEMMPQLKADWDAKPENAGKTVTNAKLWDDFANKTKLGKKDS